jgi:hypothetical protein
MAHPTRKNDLYVQGAIYGNVEYATERPGSQFRIPVSKHPTRKWPKTCRVAAPDSPPYTEKRLAKSLAMIVLGGPIAARGFMSGSFDGKAEKGDEPEGRRSDWTIIAKQRANATGLSLPSNEPGRQDHHCQAVSQAERTKQILPKRAG